MGKYRFKTKQEFVDEGRWDDEHYCPERWNYDGKMNKYLGKPVPKEYEQKCDLEKGFMMNSFYFSSNDYVYVSGEKFTIEEPSEVTQKSSSETKFKEGDKVYISNDSKFYHGGQGVSKNGDKLLGIITILNIESDWHQVEWYEDGLAVDNNHYQDHDLELAEETSPEEETASSFGTKFKLGDLVIIKESSEYSNQQEFDDEGNPIPYEVEEVDAEDSEFTYLLSNGCYYNDDDLEIAPSK